ncbi:MAG: UPF0149 family protein [Alphaproteobacteria bacterium]|nr:UPF0149 family protein [Alphaproteobacteria bacterium]
MADRALQACLEGFGKSGDLKVLQALVQTHWRTLMTPEVIADLVESVGSRPRQAQDAETELLHQLMWEARMDAENGGRSGPRVLEAAEASVAALCDRNTERPDGLPVLSSIYSRAGLRVPDIILSATITMVEGLDPGPDVPPGGIDRMLKDIVRETDGNNSALYAGFKELLAAYPPTAQAGFIRHVLETNSAIDKALAFYWLLDPEPEVQLSVAGLLSDRARNGTLGDDRAARLVMLRSWLPDDAARQAVDAAIRAAKRQAPEVAKRARRPTLHRVCASLPDGAGAQSFAIAVRDGSKRHVAMVLLKSGFGVKDAYLVPCRSANEQKGILAEIERIGLYDVTEEVIRTAIAAAIAESHAEGSPPAPGLAEVVEVCGLDGLTPQPMTLQDWMARLDPAGEIAGLSAVKRGRLVNRSEAWVMDYPAVDSWFEDNADVRQIWESSPFQRGREIAVRRYLDSQREKWASHMLRSALVLQAAEQDDGWTTFLATARALLEGRDLKKMPIMEQIMEMTILAQDHQASPSKPFEHLLSDEDDEEDFVEDDDLDGDPNSPTAIELDIQSPITPGEMERLIAEAGLPFSMTWLRGYLTALVVAPSMPRVAQAVSRLPVPDGTFHDVEAVQRFMSVFFQAYNEINSSVLNANRPGAALFAGSAAERADWASGFSEGVELNPEGWPARARKADDKKMLRLITEIGVGKADPEENAPLITVWLTARAQSRRM